LAASQPGHHLAQLWALERHRLILASLRRDLGSFGQWSWAPFLALALTLAGPGWRRLVRSEWTLAGLLVLTLAGYYGVYLLSPFELHWHLDSSLVRLLLQLWPAALFFWGLAATLPALAPLPLAVPLPAHRRTCWLAGNVICAGLLLWKVDQRLAPGELARSAFRLSPVHAVAAEGWYPAESSGSAHWSWSSGHATLRLVSARRQPVEVRFALRGLHPQHVRAEWQGQVLWSAAVGTALARMPPTILEIPAGGADLVLVSDEPGSAESTATDARTLAFALYRLQIK
jgi:hypothetical protein